MLNVIIIIKEFIRLFPFLCVIHYILAAQR